jgi:uncharacterized protein YutE (UPF0331/DUF86 family)
MSPSKLRETTLAAKTEIVHKMVAAARRLPTGSRDAFLADERNAAAAESYLWRGLEALLDICRHVLAKGFGKAVPEYAAIAKTLGQLGAVPTSTAAKLEKMARYRNRLVHFYDEVTAPELHGLLSAHLGDLEEVLAALLDWVAQHPELRDDAP